MLASPIKVGKLTLKNKMMTTSMSPCKGYIEGERPTQQMLNYMEERAAGGLGLMCQTVLPFTRKDRPEGLPHVHPLPAAYDDDCLPSLRSMAAVVQKHNCVLVGQPWFVHDWKPDDEHVEKPWGPSEVVILKGMTPFTPMEKRHIEMFKDQMVNCALTLQKAGWDGVEIMAGVGGILNRFISPATNTRTDEYGGPLKNRMRLAVETIKAVREAVGPDFLITCRWSPVEYVTGAAPGHTIEDSLLVVQYLEDAGIDMHNLAVGWHETSIPLTTKDVPDGYWTWISERIKTVATKPVAMGYRNTDPLVMEKNLQEGKADLIAGLRYDIADPAFPKKVMEDRLEDISRCIGCCRCLDDVVSSGKPLNYCSVNPRLGAELNQPRYVRTRQPKRVMVIGSGPGGLAAALTAAIRGHDVTIYERGYRVGGCLTMSSIFSPTYEHLLDYYKRQLQKHPQIKVVLKTEVTPELVKKVKPDAVVIAVGGEPVGLNVPGAEGKNVVMSHDFLEMLSGHAPQKPGLVNKVMWNAGSEFLKYFYSPALGRLVTSVSPWPMGKKIAVLGGGLPGCELAHLLMHCRRDIHIVEERKKIGFDVGGSYRFHYTSAFKQAPNVKMSPLTKVREITEKGVAVVGSDGTERFIKADTVTVTMGFKPNMALAAAIRKLVPEMYVVGDCRNPARMADATKEGYQAGCRI
jgi:2,4-dienoyl-CoA reductase (NADPH2)